MRTGVLDIGSNTGHLLVVDAHRGAAPLPASSHKQPLRLAEHLDEDGAVTKKGIKALTDFCASATQIAEELGISQMHVSRLLSRTLADLRAKLEENQPA